MPSTIDISITTPCTGSHTVTEVTSTLYVGNAQAGDFQLVVLAKTGDCWFITIYPDDPNSDCAPWTIYRQVDCDPSSPGGDYGLWDGTTVKVKLGEGKIKI